MVVLQPLACVMMKAEDAAALQRQLEARLARLGAAAAALASAAAGAATLAATRLSCLAP